MKYVLHSEAEKDLGEAAGYYKERAGASARVGWADDRKPNNGGDTGDDIRAIWNVGFATSNIMAYAPCWA
ncbi:MAG TPA: hypothetical protein VJ001_08880 [Rhodocyclaceae bacterium]|nr:hypothetical protein [Rhodocyclaceae bacterium]